MELFLISNFAISVLALLHNRFGNSGVFSKLWVSTFALACWVIPFSLTRNFFPEEAAVQLTWLAYQPIESTNQTITQVASPLLYFSFAQVFLLATFIGVLLSCYKIIKNHYWIKTLKSTANSQAIRRHNELSVFESSKVKSAALVGYSTPSIWINPSLVNTDYEEIILTHEATHAEYKDNYWLLIIELIKNIYWWNPAVALLSKNIKELLEARCDLRASQSFSEKIYQQKLASLMLGIQTGQEIQLNSLVISKNPDVRRLHYLKEAPKMNLHSKVTLTILALLTLTLLTIPVSSMQAVAMDNEQDSAVDKNTINFELEFQEVSVEVLIEVVSSFLDVEKTIVPEQLKSRQFKNLYFEGNLRELEKLTNIDWSIQDDQLVLVELAGGVNHQVMSDQQFAEIRKKIIPSLEGSENNMGALVDITVVQNKDTSSSSSSTINTKRVKSTVWTDFNKQSTLSFPDSWQIDLTIKENDRNALIALDIYTKESQQPRKLLFSPKMFTQFNNSVSAKWTQDNGDTWSIELNAQKSKNPNYNEA